LRCKITTNFRNVQDFGAKNKTCYNRLTIRLQNYYKKMTYARGRGFFRKNAQKLAYMQFL